MESCVEIKVRLKAFEFFCRAPGFAEEAIHVCSQLCAGMVEAKEWVEPHFLKFALSAKGSALAQNLLMPCVWKMFRYIFWVVRIAVRFN